VAARRSVVARGAQRARHKNGGHQEEAMTTEALADELLGVLGTGGSIAPFTARDASFGVAQAYDVAARVHAARVARGETPVGRKIGFTNRNLWEEYGVYEPIWGFVYDTTLFRPRGGRASAALAGVAAAKIEPEIVLHFKSAPPVTRNEEAILDCIDWIAAGFEIVQSPFPRWKFRLADTIAVNGLHGMLVVGDPVSVASIPDCARRLRECRVTLKKGESVAAEGVGANVLDSPLVAFAHFAGVLARLPQFPSVAAGELVTTGSLTAALDVAVGETWSATFAGIALPGLAITFK
jgi:2-oxo-3-hexenedioate decarboxylase